MDGNLTLEKLMSTIASVERLVPRIGPCHIRVHPSRYKAIIDYLQPEPYASDRLYLQRLCGIQVIQDTFVPTYRTGSGDVGSSRRSRGPGGMYASIVRFKFRFLDGFLNLKKYQQSNGESNGIHR